MREVKEGDVIVFFNTSGLRDITGGRKYTIQDTEDFIDDVGEHNWSASSGGQGVGKFIIIDDAPIIEVTSTQIRKAFTEWDRRYRENPEKFMNEAYRLLNEDEKDYGNSVTPYFMDLLREFKEN